ncbi:MAG TPA: 16S rRNA (guanine(527)-N(7))-methyltransferase RsmG, partial [Desulfuromonadales bacterium]|nr:16S rRNA (guanine(527)-N(7))-methyltransferase RsmG [Desulfuromonadales bacterium]
EALREAGLTVPGAVEAKLLSYLDELLRWNRRINLTAITDPAVAVEKHLVDSLTLLTLLKGDERLLDFGSGGGLPGIPLKIARAGLKILSVDAVRKKIDFQRHVVRYLGLSDFIPLHARAEEVPGRPEAALLFDLVVTRAVGPLVDLTDLAFPLLVPEGRLVAMKGPEGEREAQESEPSLAERGLYCSEVKRLHLPLSGAERLLVTVIRRK